MSKKLVYVLAAVLGLSACDKTGKMETTKTGLRYMFHKGDTTGKKPKMGDVITMRMVVRNGKDSIIGNSSQQAPDGLIKVALQPAPYKGSLEEGFALLSAGDSVTFFVSVDSLVKQFPGQPLPPFLQKGTDIKYSMLVTKVQTQEELKKEMEELAVKQKDTDAKTIADYVSKNKLANVQKTASGLNYIVTQPGTGKQATAQDTVTVKYTGKLLNGTEFDSSTRQPGGSIEFPLNRVIPGWTEGIALLKEGSKATLIIPSGLAYGPQGAPPTIPPNSVLVFDVELVKVK